MKKTLSALLLILCAGPASSGTFSVGSTDLDIPAPNGFSRVTPEMDAVYRMSLQMADGQNDLLAYYIPDEEVPAATAGEFPSLERTFAVKVSKQLKDVVVGAKDFSELVAMVKSQNKQIFEAVSAQVKEAMEQTNAGIQDEFDLNLALQVSQMIPLDPHHESDNSLAYSMYINYGSSSGDTEEASLVSATATFVNASGKVLFLYCYAPRAELEWTRSASKTWAESLLAGNKAPPARASGGSGLDWSRVLGRAGYGAVIGGAVALVFAVISRRRKKKDE